MLNPTNNKPTLIPSHIIDRIRVALDSLRAVGWTEYAKGYEIVFKQPPADLLEYVCLHCPTKQITSNMVEFYIYEKRICGYVPGKYFEESHKSSLKYLLDVALAFERYAASYKADFEKTRANIAKDKARGILLQVLPFRHRGPNCFGGT
jgi:hypothetical protein